MTTKRAHSAHPDKIRPTASNRPSRHFMLTLWFMLYRIELQKTLDRDDELAACNHTRLGLDRWDMEKAWFPRQWDKLIAKRQRRRDWFDLHGEVPDGWTPPDPLDPRRTANKPMAAYLARRRITLDQFRAQYSWMAVIPKKGGKQPPWKMILRVSSWRKA